MKLHWANIKSGFLRLLDRLPDTSIVAALLCLLVASAGGALTHIVKTDTIRIVSGELPPQINLSGNGQEADIIRAAFREVYGERKIEFHVMPFTRHWDSFVRDRRFDAVTTVPTSLDIEGFRSDIYINYQNGIIYRQVDFPKGLGTEPVSALKGKRVVAFAGASGILPEVQKNVPGFRSYAEYDDQYIHSVMLSRGYVDAVLADKLIVDHNNRLVMKQNYVSASHELIFSPVFCPTPYTLIFRSDELRDAFNRGLNIIAKNGKLEKINRRYNLASAIRDVSVKKRECN